MSKKNKGLKKSVGPQKFWLQNFFGPSKFCPKSFVKIRSVTAEKVSAKKIVVSKKIWVKQNFGPKNQGSQKLAQISSVKIGSTAKIFMIWTNVARTNVAWTYVTVTVKSVQNGLMNLPLKFGQNRVSNS